MQWNSPLVHGGMPQGPINSSRSSISNWVSCLHDWLLLANAINYSRLSPLIALRNLTNLTSGFSNFGQAAGLGTGKILNSKLEGCCCLENLCLTRASFVSTPQSLYLSGIKQIHLCKQSSGSSLQLNCCTTVKGLFHRKRIQESWLV